jgi:hypothetical protein
VSLANVQNLAVQAGLAAGRWTYVASGILDVGHLRFFTLEQGRDLLEGAGLSVIHVDSALDPALDLSSVRELGNSFHQGKLTLSDLTRQEFLRLYAAHYIVTARRRGSSSSHALSN